MFKNESTSRTSTIDRISIFALLLSGFIHIPIFYFSGIPWENPESFRKPILFGLSTGLTLWSCHWTLSKLRPIRWEHLIRFLLSTSLLFEVILITIQPWRGRGSHFNHTSFVDQRIEESMLVLISIATAILGWITYLAFDDANWEECLTESPTNELQSNHLQTTKLAVRWGMICLLASCVIGFAITIVGTRNLISGMSPHVMGKSGLLKFPHGSVMHAIQAFALLSWLAVRLHHTRALQMMRIAIVTHGVILIYAVEQTVRGLPRTPSDGIGWTILIIAIGLGGWCVGTFLVRPKQSASKS